MKNWGLRSSKSGGFKLLKKRIIETLERFSGGNFYIK
jgi:hypothetical protein